MSLEAILEEIRARGRTEILDVEKHNETRVQQILEQARAEAEEIHQEVCEEIAAPGRGEAARVVNQAELQAMRILDDARQESINETLDRVRAQLAEVRRDDDYPHLLRQLVRECISNIDVAMGQEEIRLQADERDKDLIEHFLKDYDDHINVSYDLEVWGGLLARSQDGRVTVTNTFESRLEEALPYLRRYLAAQYP